MDVAKAGQIAILMLSPTLVVRAALYLPRGVWLRRLLTARHIGKRLQPTRRLLHTLAEAGLVLPPRCQFVRAQYTAVTQPPRARNGLIPITPATNTSGTDDHSEGVSRVHGRLTKVTC